VPPNGVMQGSSPKKTTYYLCKTSKGVVKLRFGSFCRTCAQLNHAELENDGPSWANQLSMNPERPQRGQQLALLMRIKLLKCSIAPCAST